MAKRAHWSEKTSCICGKTFRIGSSAEVRHRHNFPMLCSKRGLDKFYADLRQKAVEKAQKGCI